VRTWSVLNDCVPTGANNPSIKAQRIKVVDDNGPTFTCPASITVSVNQSSCCANAALPSVVMSEGCSKITGVQAMVTGINPANGNNIQFVVPGTLTDFPGNNYWNPDTLATFGPTQCLPLSGTYTVMYVATDGCANSANCTFTIKVEDFVAPIATCDQTTTVSLGDDDLTDCYTPGNGCKGAGVAWVNAKEFDDGSKDRCNQVKFTVRRMPPYSACIENLPACEKTIATAESDSIKFYCCEAGTKQRIILRVYQVDANGVWQAGKYIPAYLRRFPFFLVRVAEGSDELALCMDTAAPQISTTEGEILFGADGKPTPILDQAFAFSRSLEAAMQKTRALTDLLTSLNLLQPTAVQFEQNGKPTKIDGFHAVQREAFAALPAPLRKRLRVQQQSRPEMLETARSIYAAAGIEAEVAPFFGDMARRLATTHLVIGRAGASTCSELAVAALPSLLIPLKIAMDDHQRFNALSLVEAGGAEMVLEDEATVERLTAALLALLSDPARLAEMSAGARSAALPDATVELADMVEAVAG
jgi:hypothetical protein